MNLKIIFTLKNCCTGYARMKMNCKVPLQHTKSDWILCEEYFDHNNPPI